MFMVMLVLDDPSRLDSVLDAWHEAGIGGATITESTGYFRRRQPQPIGARYLFGATRLPEPGGEGNFTLFAIVPDEATAQTCLTVTETITGNLDDPNTGVFAAWPLGLVKGLPPRKVDAE